MALWHDIGARVMRLSLRAAIPAGGEPVMADTEAGPVRLWSWRGTSAGADDDVPVYLHFPETRFVAPAAADEAAFASELAEALGGVVLVAEPPLAPKRRFPQAPVLAQAVAWWAMLAGRKQGWNGKRLAIGGRGTGANLAIGACLELPARMGVKPRGVVALAPVLDLARARGWRERAAFAAYLPDRLARRAPLASPLHAPPESLAGFAPSLVVVEETDPRRDEGEGFAALLRQAGREARLVSMPRAEGATHEVAAFLGRVLPVAGRGTADP